MRRFPKLLAAALAALPLALVASSGCSKSQDACSDDKCAANNVCAGEPAVCSLKCNLHTDCPDGFACRPATASSSGQTMNVCQALASPVPTGNGGYLTSCAADPQNTCDSANGFGCLGAANDVNAVCTKPGGCATDTDCPPSQTCATMRARACASVIATRECVNDARCKARYGAAYKCVDIITQGGQTVADGYCEKSCTGDGDCESGESCLPIAPGAPRSRCYAAQTNDWCTTQPDSCPTGYSCTGKPGDTTQYKLVTACAPRTFCSPCTTDSDCGSLSAACIPDASGNKFCSELCAATSAGSCPPEAKCASVGTDATGHEVDRCMPRAGSCTAAAPTTCSPCRSDGDCGASGICLTTSYSNEHYCAATCQHDADCGKTPGGEAMTCCTDATQCGSQYGKCVLPYNTTEPDPRYSEGCWIPTCKSNSDCDVSLHQVCWPRDNVCVNTKTCASDNDCLAETGQHCDATSGLCVAQPCKASSDCIFCKAYPTQCSAYVQCDTTLGVCLPP